jgi:hypothetical protein
MSLEARRAKAPNRIHARPLFSMQGLRGFEEV